MKRALLVIDMLNDFAPGGGLPVEDVHKIVLYQRLKMFLILLEKIEIGM